MTKPGSFPWAPGKNLPHPDAEAIIAWARGLVHLDIIHVPDQGDLVTDGVWMPSDFPTMNPTRKRVRIRPEKKMACIHRARNDKLGVQTAISAILPEKDVAGWDANHPDRVRISDWTPVWEV